MPKGGLRTPGEGKKLGPPKLPEGEKKLVFAFRVRPRDVEKVKQFIKSLDKQRE